MRLKLLTIILFLGFLESSVGQLNPDETSQIDELFKTWQATNHPGGSIGIMKKGAIVYSKAYGLASLEYQIPNRTSTIYNSASVSKQFTAMGIVLLHLEGKIDIDANINTYLDNMPQFRYPVTVRQMLHHTSGLRSMHAMLGLAGWRANDLRTNEDLYRFVEQQEDLNFKPNDRYLYCNTGYVLMAKIIEDLTGEKFSIWMKKEIFDPLGMSSTYVEDKYSSVEPNNAMSYYATKNSFERAVEFWGYVGSGNMHTTTDDLLIWLSNFSKPKKGWEDAFKMIQTMDHFNDGSLNNYAFGIKIDSLNGNKRIQHSGAIGGFRAFVSSYPERDLQIAILSNFSRSNPGKIEKAVSNILLPPLEKPEIQAKKTISLNAKDLKQYIGDYWDSDQLQGSKLYIEEDTLKLANKISGNEIRLVPLTKSSFMSVGNPKLIYKFSAEVGSSKKMQVLTKGKTTAYLESYTPITVTEKDLLNYLGQFYSRELETFYKIYLKEGGLYSHHVRHGDHRLKWIKKDVLKGNYPLNLLVFKRNSDNEITGVNVSNGRVKNAEFVKVSL